MRRFFMRLIQWAMFACFCNCMLLSLVVTSGESCHEGIFAVLISFCQHRQCASSNRTVYQQIANSTFMRLDFALRRIFVMVTQDDIIIEW